MNTPSRTVASASSLASAFAACAGAALIASFFGLTHLYDLQSAPGLHYDEAWAANFATRILREPGFRPFEAMSPYTAAWGHHWGALWMKAFGVSLVSFRASQIALVAMGLALGSWALARRGAGLAAALFPVLVAFTPALVLNHRFAIDVNTFLPLCLGLLAAGASLRGSRPRAGGALIALGCCLGITSHLLFIGPALGLFLATRWGRGTRDRWLVTGVCAALFPFFLKVLLQIPEKDKALALILVELAVVGAAWWPARMPALSAVPRALKLLAGLLACILGGFLGCAFLFFWEGHWAVLYTLGRVQEPWLIGSQLLLAGVLLLSVGPALWRSSPLFRALVAWLGGTIFVLSFLMTKPSSRYFETGFLLFSGCLALALASLERLRPRRLGLWLACFAAVGAFDLHLNYWRPSELGLQEEREFRFAFFRDSSRDSLPKQRVASFLAANGCGLERVRSGDPRVMEALRFLAEGDWVPDTDNPERRICQWPEVRVERELSESARISNLDWIIARISGLLVLR